MSKAKLTFTLPEEQEEFETAANGWKYKILVGEIKEKIRRKIKDEEYSEEVFVVLNELQEFIVITCIDEGLEP
jgi:hypothetical protein